MLDALAAIAKALLYAGLLSSAGAVFAESTLRIRSQPAVQFLALVMRRGAWLTIAACLAGALILIFRLGGAFDEATLSAVFLASSGAAISLQLAGSALLLATPGADASSRATRLSNAAIMTLSFAVNSHAATVAVTSGLVAFLHVSAAAWWVASLWLLRHACERLDFDVVADLLRRFSAIALAAIGALVALAVVLIIVLVDFSRELWLRPYEQILAVKVGLVLAALALASFNRMRLTPRLLAGDRAAVRSLRAMISGELAVIGAVVVTTAVLTTYSSPHE